MENTILNEKQTEVNESFSHVMESLTEGKEANTLLVVSARDLERLIRSVFNECVSSPDEWMDARQVASAFGLSFANIRNAQWREKHNMPTHQPAGAFSKPFFLRSEITEWIKNSI